MKIIRINDLIDIGIFKQYKINYPNEFNELFGENENIDSILDNLLSDIYGNNALLKKYSFQYLENPLSMINRLLTLLNLRFYKEWLEIKKVVESVNDFDVLHPIKETKETTQNNLHENEFNNQNKENAYDSIQASDTSQNHSTTEINETNKEKIEWHRSNNMLATDIAQKLIDFHKLNDFYAIVLRDIVNFCTIRIEV